jgi:hypothetical protein
MTWIIWGVGCVVIVAISVAIITVCLFGIVELLGKLQERQDGKTRQLAASDLGKDMLVNSYWFSEDEATMNLLKLIGNSLVRSRCCSFDPNKIRDEWRKNRELVSATLSEPTEKPNET